MDKRNWNDWIQVKYIIILTIIECFKINLINI